MPLQDEVFEHATTLRVGIVGAALGSVQKVELRMGLRGDVAEEVV